MKRLLISLLAVFLAMSMLTACTTSQRKDTGMVAGAVVGGVAGHALTNSTAGTIIGAAGGAYVGRQLAQ